MSQTNVRRFVVEQDEALVNQQPQPAPAAAQPPGFNAALQLLMLSLKTLSQRTIVALSKLFTLLTVGTVFWLCMVTPDPTVFQLVKIAMYSIFVLLANWIVSRAA